MFTRLRDQFSTTALILSIVALVFAMLGGAYAASQPQAKKTKVVKGKQGPRGKQGPPGPQGPAGTNGTAGPKGDRGEAGPKGDPGQDGASVEVTELVEPECDERNGVEVKVKGQGSGVQVCEGEEGSPWTAGGTLPPGATETGAWTIDADSASAAFGQFAFAPISFTIPLAAGLDNAHVLFQGGTGFSEHCHGPTSGTEPQADAGYLCVYGSPFNRENLAFSSITKLDFGPIGTNKAGALLVFEVEGDNAYGFGSWAVTG